jgi:hypothetical protein
MKRIAAALILAVSQGLAQTPAVRGPVLGYIFDPGVHAIRPVLGVPGAAILGQPLDLGEPVDRAIISPRQDLAFAVASSDSRVLTVSLPSGAVEACECTPGPDRMVFSPSGDAAALYYAADSRVLVLRGAKAGFDLSLLLGEVTALAVSDAGDLLAAFSNGVYYFVQGGEPRLALSLSRASALAFFSKSSDALVADDIDNRLYVIRDSGGRAEARLAATDGDGISGPIAVLAVGSSKVLTANSKSGVITISDLAAGTTSAIECGVPPDDLQPLNGSVYRLTAPSSGPVWLLDGDSAGARVVFVPREGKP